MLNQTPLWKYLLVIFVVAICALYASPNLYSTDNAVQISASGEQTVDMQLLDRVSNELAQLNIQPKRTTLENDQILVRLTNQEDQYIAQEKLQVTLGEDYVVAMNLAPDTPNWLKSLGGDPMKLGLDLRGGVHFLMEVDMNTAMNKTLEDQVGDFRTALREEKIRYRRVVKTDDAVEIQFRDQDTLDKAKFFLRNRNRDFEYSEPRDLVLAAKMSEQRLTEVRNYAVQQNITILRNRVSQLGVAEPVIQKQGAERIVVQLPGIQDTAKAKQILNATATLEYREADVDGDVQAAADGRIPPGSELFMYEGRPVLLKKQIIVEGSHIIDANSGVDQYGIPKVSVSLDSKGGNKMLRFTKRAVGKPMAVVFVEYKATGERDENDKLIFRKDERVISYATIRGVFSNAFETTGLDSPREAQELALLLRAGALIAPIQIVEERTVGPSLGQENIELGTTAIVWGFLLVLAFMLMYYKGFGVVANVALAVNLIMVIGVMSLVPGATLTLPGMAGIVLTVGMAVDANVLIFERIREELRDGRSPQQAIHHGYDSAFSTIIDANITTFIAALILYAVGTGPIQGFAVTLMIGIVTSVFTAIILTRAIVNGVWGGRRLQKLSI